jgi:hypothetical protein
MAPQKYRFWWCFSEKSFRKKKTSFLAIFFHDCSQGLNLIYIGTESFFYKATFFKAFSEFFNFLKKNAAPYSFMFYFVALDEFYPNLNRVGSENVQFS